jgi:hypothetical protein
MPRDYRVRLVLQSGDQRLLLGENLPLGRADHPTRQWIAGEVVRSLHTMRVPAAAPAGEYAIEATIGEPEGQPSGIVLDVAAGELEPIERQWGRPSDMQPVDADLGGRVQLLGYSLTPADGEALFAPGSQLSVTLYWQAQRDMPISYKVFVQWVGAGQALAQNDAVPGGWQRPTTGWVPGEVIVDRHVLALPSALPAGEYTLIAGMYDERTLRRLPRLDGSGSTLGDHVVLERTVIE